MRRRLGPNWYRRLRHRVGPDMLILGRILVVAMLGLGGIFTVHVLDGGTTSTSAYVPLTTTVMRRVKVVEHGRTVLRRVPVVKRIYAKPVTVQETRTVQTPRGTTIVTKPIVRYQPVYRRRVVLVHGKPVTVNQVVTDTRMLTNTQVQTVTNEHTSTVVNELTSTVVDRRTQTLSQTVTTVRTETLPSQTVTVTGPTQTATVTTTVESTVTVQPPPVTITITTQKG